MSVMIQTDPSIMDGFDGDAAFKHIGIDLHGIDPTLFRDDKDIKIIRDQRAEAQKQAFEVEMAQKRATVNSTNANAEAAGG